MPRISLANVNALLGEASLPRAAFDTGIAAIDQALPWGGFPRGLHEIASPPGDGAGIGFAAALMRRRSGPILWCASRRAWMETGTPYGPGLAEFGLSPDRLIVVEAEKPIDLLWAMEEGLRSKSLAFVLGEGAVLDLTASRRLQLAAEAGDGMALVLPPSFSQSAPSLAAVTRWLVRSAPSIEQAGGPGRPRWLLELWRCRGGGRPQSWMVEWDDAALSLDLVPLLGDRPLAAAAA